MLRRDVKVYAAWEATQDVIVVGENELKSAGTGVDYSSRAASREASRTVVPFTGTFTDSSAVWIRVGVILCKNWRLVNVGKKMIKDLAKSWVITTPTLITKASLSFPAKVWWVVVHAQLQPTANDNTLSPSLASLVACLMVGYLVNAGWIIASEMRDRALNERAGLPFSCLIGKLCQQASIPPNRLVDRWGETFRLIQVSKIKDVANHLFGAKSVVVGTLVVVPHVPIEIPHANRGPEQGESSQPSTEAPPPPASASQALGTFFTIPMLFLKKLVADQRQTRTLVDQIVNRMAQLIQRNVLAVKNELKNEMRKKLDVLKDRMDGLENLIQERFQAAGSVDTEEFKSQLAEM
uniref:Putative plant transposon protein domain-containing protein n=1 Tax=Solanum tuberosum TaxID=4113 RepID=M1DZ55_SOLTU